jgi:hypothetical protein
VTTLYLLCGKIAAGKSTLAQSLAARPSTLLVSMDHWMSALFPGEVKTIEEFADRSARLRVAMGPHLVDILRQNLSVGLMSGSDNGRSGSASTGSGLKSRGSVTLDAPKYRPFVAMRCANSVAVQRNAASNPDGWRPHPCRRSRNLHRSRT